MFDKFESELVHLDFQLNNLPGERVFSPLELSFNFLAEEDQILINMLKSPSAFIIDSIHLGLQKFEVMLQFSHLHVHRVWDDRCNRG